MTEGMPALIAAEIDSYDQVLQRAIKAEQELAAAEAQNAAARELHGPEPMRAGEYDDGTCALCAPHMGGPRPLLRRFRGHLNGAKALSWMHEHPDWFPQCGSCAGGGWDKSYADWPCPTATAIGYTELPREWVKP